MLSAFSYITILILEYYINKDKSVILEGVDHASDKEFVFSLLCLHPVISDACAACAYIH